MSKSYDKIADKSRGTVELTESDHYKLLAARHRRLALDVLAEQTSSITVRELASEIAEREHGSATDGDSIERIATQLHHIHLPVMVDLGVISYDSDSNRVTPPRVLITV